MLEKQGTRQITFRAPHSWHTAYALALREPDSGEMIGRIKYAIRAIERRNSEWETDPGSPAELKAIQSCISILQRLMKQEQTRRRSAVLALVGGNSETNSLPMPSN